MMWFAVKRGCSITTLRNSVNQHKFADNSVVHAWLTEDSDLSFHEGTAVNFTHQSCQSGLSAVPKRITHKNRPLDTFFLTHKSQTCSHSTYRAEFVPILIHRSEVWTFKIQDKKRLTVNEKQVFLKKKEGRLGHFWPQKELRHLEENQLSNNNEIQIKLSTKCNRKEQQQDGKIILNYRPNRRRRFWRTC